MSNTLENFDRYEVVKDEIEVIYKKLKNSNFEGGGNPMEYLYEQLEVLEKAALNYRREHNIYEEGDQVVLINKCRSPKLWTWVHITNWRPNHSLLKCEEPCLYPFADSEYRHATNFEIELGARRD